MKIVELTKHGVSMPITNEEAELLSKFYELSTIPRRNLTEREIYIANQLVNKDMLIRKVADGKTTYTKQTK